MSTITPAASATPQVSRKSGKNMNKKELGVEVNRLRGKEELYKSNLNKLRDEIKSLKSRINELKKEREQYKSSRGLHKTVIDLEKQTAEQEQYSRGECMELFALPENTNVEERTSQSKPFKLPVLTLIRLGFFRTVFSGKGSI